MRILWGKPKAEAEAEAEAEHVVNAWLSFYRPLYPII
jgi:hypothetical protein